MNSSLAELIEIDKLQNFWGHLTVKQQRRLLAVLRNPNEQNWNKAYSIILRYGPGWGVGFTLWMAWCAVDPNAWKLGPVWVGLNKRWLRIPDAVTLYNAVRFAATAKTRTSRWQNM